MKNTLIQRIKIGIVKGWNIPTLPKGVITFLDLPFIRILRVLGGISVIIVLLKKHTLFPPVIEYLIL
jgi:hypothetical protein